MQLLPESLPSLFGCVSKGESKPTPLKCSTPSTFTPVNNRISVDPAARYARLFDPQGNHAAWSAWTICCKITESNLGGVIDEQMVINHQGNIYLAAVIDWYSRKILSWQQHNLAHSDH